MSIRYTDLNPAKSGVRDFVIRRRSPTIVHLLGFFLCAIMITVSVTMTIIDRLALLTVLLILFGATAIYVAIILQRSRDLLLATEFQNALFASAIGLNNKFCLIIRRDGNIIYFDQSFQKMFPELLKQANRTVDIMLDHGHVSREDRQKIFAGIDSGVFSKAIFDIRSADNKPTRLVMTIEPIMRPSGFILLRGREYVENRAGAAGKAGRSGTVDNASTMDRSTITLFSYVMDSMNMGVYMTGPNGSVVYANAVLEQWLGYREGEITSNNLSLQDIIYQNGGKRTDPIEPDNYEGEIALQKKDGGLVKMFINQKVIRDEKGSPMGCTALVHHFDSSPSAQKKPW